MRASARTTRAVYLQGFDGETRAGGARSGPPPTTTPRLAAALRQFACFLCVGAAIIAAVVVAVAAAGTPFATAVGAIVFLLAVAACATESVRR